MAADRPVLTIKGYRFSHELFEKGFPVSGGPCKCSSVCCSDGVYADVTDRERIFSHKEIIKKYMDNTQLRDEARWFETREIVDADFPSGRCVGTEAYGGKCVFLDGSGRCTLQVAAAAEGMHKWALKPFFCVLYPIEVTNGLVSFDDMLQGEQSCCSIGHEFEMALFEGCKDELIYLIGPEGFKEMEDHYAALQAKGQPVNAQNTGA